MQDYRANILDGYNLHNRTFLRGALSLPKRIKGGATNQPPEKLNYFFLSLHVTFTSDSRIEVKTWQLISWGDVIYSKEKNQDPYRIEKLNMRFISVLRTCAMILIGKSRHITVGIKLTLFALIPLFSLWIKQDWKLIWETLVLVLFRGYPDIKVFRTLHLDLNTSTKV